MPSPPAGEALEATVRFATESDIPTILALIHDLAAYEHASHLVHATESSLLNTLSFPTSSPSRPGYARTLLIFPPTTPTNNEKPEHPECAGLALYFHNYSTWRAAPGIYLEDLFIRPAYRGRGFGKRLLGELAREVKNIGGERLEWSVLRWNEPSLRFYEGVGARKMSGWMGMRVDDLEGTGEGEEGGEEGGELLRLAGWGKGVVWE